MKPQGLFLTCCLTYWWDDRVAGYIQNHQDYEDIKINLVKKSYRQFQCLPYIHPARDWIKTWAWWLEDGAREPTAAIYWNSLICGRNTVFLTRVLRDGLIPHSCDGTAGDWRAQPSSNTCRVSYGLLIQGLDRKRWKSSKQQQLSIRRQPNVVIVQQPKRSNPAS